MTTRIDRREFLGACGALVASAYAGPALALADPLCVIVAARNAQTELSESMLRRVFLAQPTNDVQGRRFIPLNAAPGTRERVDFDERVLNLDADEAARFWIDQRIRGVQAPRSAPSIDVVLRVVARLPGAISYVPRAYLRPDVKVLRIGDKLPGDRGYLLER